MVDALLVEAEPGATTTQGVFSPYPVGTPSNATQDAAPTSLKEPTTKWAPPAHFKPGIDGIQPKKVAPVVEPQTISTITEDIAVPTETVVATEVQAAQEPVSVATPVEEVVASVAASPAISVVPESAGGEGYRSLREEDAGFQRFMGQLIGDAGEQGATVEAGQGVTGAEAATVPVDAHDELPMPRLESVSYALKGLRELIVDRGVSLLSPPELPIAFERPLFTRSNSLANSPNGLIPVAGNQGISVKTLAEQELETLESKFPPEFIEMLVEVHTISPPDYFASVVLALTEPRLNPSPLYVWEQLGEKTVNDVLYLSGENTLNVFPSEEAKKENTAIDIRQTASKFTTNLIQAHLLMPTITDWHNNADIEALKGTSLRALDRLASETIRRILT